MDRDDKRGGRVLIPISKILYFVFVWKLFIEISAWAAVTPKLEAIGTWAAFLFVSCCSGWKKEAVLGFRHVGRVFGQRNPDDRMNNEAMDC